MVNNKNAATLRRYVANTGGTTSSATVVYDLGHVTPAKVAKRDVKNAVYAHIRAVRALGRTNINTVEIAKALGLPLSAVQQAVSSLSDKGVKHAG